MVRHAQVGLVQNLLNNHDNGSQVFSLPAQLLDVIDSFNAAVRACRCWAWLATQLLLLVSLLIYTDVNFEEAHLRIDLLRLDAQVPEVDVDNLGLFFIVILCSLGSLGLAALLELCLLGFIQCLFHLYLVDDFEVGDQLDDGHVRRRNQLNALHLAFVSERQETIVQLLHGLYQLFFACLVIARS